MKLRAKDGTPRFILWNSANVFDEDGTLKALIGFGHDITDQKYTEKTLKESEERFRLLTDFTKEAIVIHDTGVIQEANQAFLTMFGYEVSEIIGTTGERLFTSDSWAIATNMAIQENEEPYDLIGVKKDGTVFPVQVWGRTVPYQSKMVRGVVIRDLTREKKIEAELRREWDLFEKITQTSPASIVMIDISGRITYSNDQALKTLQITAEEHTSRTYNDPKWKIIDMDGKPCADENLPFYQVITTGKPVYDVRHGIEMPDGKRLFLSINAAPLFTTDGKIESVIASVEDITGRLEAEEKLLSLNRSLEERARELQEAMAEIRTMSGLLPICSYCKKIRDDKGYWNQIEIYIQEHSQADFSHSICPDCFKRHFPGIYVELKEEGKLDWE